MQPLGCCERRLRLPLLGSALSRACAGAWSQCCLPAGEGHSLVDAVLEMLWPGQVEDVLQDGCPVQGTLQAQRTRFSLCCCLVHGGALPLQVRGWDEGAFLAEHIVLSWRCLLQLQKQWCGVWGLSGFSRKGGSSQASYARSFCFALLVCGLTGKGESPPSTAPIQRENWASPSIRACVVPKGERTSHVLLAPPTQGTSDSVFPLLAKLLEKRIRMTKASSLPSFQLIPIPGSVAETAAGRMDEAYLSKSWL